MDAELEISYQLVLMISIRQEEVSQTLVSRRGGKQILCGYTDLKPVSLLASLHDHSQAGADIVVFLH